MARKRALSEMPLHLMILPGLVLVFLFNYIPMFGLVIAFQKFIPVKGIFGSQWIGLDNFRYLFDSSDFFRILRNTVFIAFMKIASGLVIPITISLLLNEMRKELIKRFVQTLIYLPHFLSWVILGGILVDILSPSKGIVNQLIQWLGGTPQFFMGSNSWFPYTLVISHEWKEFGFSTIIYLAAITAINPALYEAATVDGAGRLQQMWHISLPGIMNIIVLMATLSMGNVLNAGFEQVFNLYSPVVYQSGDIIDTYVYRVGLVEAQYGLATAVGVFKSVISFMFIAGSYTLAYRLANYRIF
jgi:putative aldouronate transport system permease protein